MNDERLAVLKKIKTAYRTMVNGAKSDGFSTRAQAEALGVKTCTVSNASNPKNRLHLPSIDMIILHGKYVRAYYAANPDIKPSCNPCAVMDEINFIDGRVAFALPEIAGDPNGINTLLAENVQEFADVMSATGEMMADGLIERSEYERFEIEIMQQVRKSMALLHAAKGMVVEDGEVE